MHINSCREGGKKMQQTLLSAGQADWKGQWAQTDLSCTLFKYQRTFFLGGESTKQNSVSVLVVSSWRYPKPVPCVPSLTADPALSSGWIQQHPEGHSRLSRSVTPKPQSFTDCRNNQPLTLHPLPNKREVIQASVVYCL